MSLTNKKVSATYKDLLQLDNSNSGATIAGNVVKDGNGTSTALTLGTRNCKFQPSADHTSIFLVENAAGDDVLKVDTTNKLVKVNETQVAANTQYLRFMAKDIDVDSGTHFGVPVVGFYTSGSAEMPNTEITFGTGTNPAVPSFNTNSADDMIHYLHYVDTNIVIDSVNVLVGATGSSGDSLNFHLVSLSTADSTTVDDFQTCSVVADDSGTTNNGYEQFNRVSLDIQSPGVGSGVGYVDAGNYLALTIEGDGTNSDYTVNALVRYHLR